MTVYWNVWKSRQPMLPKYNCFQFYQTDSYRETLWNARWELKTFLSENVSEQKSHRNFFISALMSSTLELESVPIDGEFFSGGSLSRSIQLNVLQTWYDTDWLFNKRFTFWSFLLLGVRICAKNDVTLWCHNAIKYFNGNVTTRVELIKNWSFLSASRQNLCFINFTGKMVKIW